jgi:predicted lipoprotein
VLLTGKLTQGVSKAKMKSFAEKVFIDCDGEEIEIVKINANGVLLRDSSDEYFVTSVGTLLQDIESG